MRVWFCETTTRKEDWRTWDYFADAGTHRNVTKSTATFGFAKLFFLWELKITPKHITLKARKRVTLEKEPTYVSMKAFGYLGFVCITLKIIQTSPLCLPDLKSHDIKPWMHIGVSSRSLNSVNTRDSVCIIYVCIHLVQTGGDSNDKPTVMRSQFMARSQCWTTVSKKTELLSAPHVNCTGNNQPQRRLLWNPEPGPSSPSRTYA